MRCHAKTDRGVSKAEDRSCGGNQRWSSELRDRNEQASRRGDHALVVARELHILPLSAQELDRSEMQRIERAHGHRERLERTRDHRRGNLEESEALHQFTRELAVLTRYAPSVETVP
jgi:hypothetical protein